MNQHGYIGDRKMDRAEYMDVYGIHEDELHEEPEEFCHDCGADSDLTEYAQEGGGIIWLCERCRDAG